MKRVYTAILVGEPARMRKSAGSTPNEMMKVRNKHAEASKV